MFDLTKAKSKGSMFLMNFGDELRKKSPSIVSATAIITFVGASIALWKAHDKVKEDLKKRNDTISDISPDATDGEKNEIIKEANIKCVKSVTIHMLPFAVLSTATILNIIMAQKMNNKRIAAYSALLGIAEKNSDEFKKKMEEIVGKGKVEKAEDEIRKKHAEDSMENIDNCCVINTGVGNTYFLDDDSGQVFISELNYIRGRVNDFNQEMLEVCSAYYDQYEADSYEQDCTDIYKSLGLHVPIWATLKVWRRSRLMDVSWTVQVLNINGVNREVYIIKFINEYKTYSSEEKL